ncbi:proline-specific peptidase [Myriangium duriaei CBS 260.36]|uniref:Proline-specific peptidase n=1 Tax=Myriangium duriaei CBS 260.36 TaxID=1168546 RepID=A0A9P4IV36_9PEZI|nr:proline-specific peptidase [Myriangium duriaei CBS 260.36]
MTALIPTREGTIPFPISAVDKPCFTYFKVFGDLSKGTPVVCLHGGPGAGHEYMLPFAELWPKYNIPVILYDQIGCASSTHLQEKAGDKAFWQEDLFVRELDNLLDHLQLRGGFHLLGHSWGGMLGPAFASRRPQGLQRLILASGNASKELSMLGASVRRDELPPQHLEAILEAERTRNLDTAAYKEAMNIFNQRYLCRTMPPPAELLLGVKNMAEDKTVFGTMNGLSPMFQNGSMLHWTSIPRLPQINVPTLVYNGEYDASIDASQEPFFEKISLVRWIRFIDAGHMCHLEARGIGEKVLKAVGDFLTVPIEEQKFGERIQM